ncbi:MAG TPA: hypothetical protein VLC09_05335 [Polyangiaceae bacterium]|nr:hypothetical protein [Polyangiaceae bacterium]
MSRAERCAAEVGAERGADALAAKPVEPGVRRRAGRWGYVLLLVGSALSVAACVGSSSDAGDGGGGSGGSSSQAFECGSETCSPDQICLVTQAGPFASTAPTRPTCAAPPTDCGAASICECVLDDLTDEGFVVTGCANVSGPTVWITDIRCGDVLCNDQQACVVVGSLQGAATDQRCELLPANCEVDETFCQTDCPTRLADRLELQMNGCSAADWGVGIYVDE